MDTNQVACHNPNQLILDGPHEIIHRRLNQFQKINQETALSAERNSLEIKLKREKVIHAQAFIQRFRKTYGITEEQMKSLVSGLENEEIKLLESRVIAGLKRQALLQFCGATSLIATNVGLIMASIFSGSELLINLALLMNLSGLGNIFPVVFLADFFSDHISTTFVSYFGIQRLTKKKYGPDYFPYQELKEELGLVANTETEQEEQK